jgi:hypothetical protein
MKFATENIRDLPQSIQAYAMIHHELFHDRFHILSNSLFINHPIIRRYIVQNADTAIKKIGAFNVISRLYIYY